MNQKIHNRGFSLIEVLVALLVLAIGLLGLAALQATSLSFNADSYSRTQVTLLVYDIVDKMRANPTGFTAGSYDVVDDGAAATAISNYASCSGAACQCDTGGSCNSTNLAMYDLGTWYAKLADAQVLSDANSAGRRATIVRDAANLVTITINWSEREVDRQQQWRIQL